MASLIDFIKEKHRTTPLWIKVLAPFLLLGGFAVFAVIGAVTAFVVVAWLGQPVPVLGFDQSIEQPIAFPHTIHAGTGVYTDAEGQSIQGLNLDCTYCHRTATTQANAGVPSAALCAYCHKVIGPETNPELAKLRSSAGLTEDPPSPINWKRVHRLPDHVRFAHEPHIRFLTQHPDVIKNAAPGVNQQSEVVPAMVCSTCHGDVASMKEVAQVESLKMGQCVDCHRENEAPTDCTVCHH